MSTIKDQDYAVRDFEKFQAMCKKVGTQAKTLQENIHRCISSGGFHYHAHSNASVFNEIVKVLPEGIRMERIKEYCNFHFGVVWNEADATFKKDKKWERGFVTTPDADGNEVLDIGHYRENKWFDHNVQKLDPAWLLKKKIEALSKAMEKHAPEVSKQKHGAMGAWYDLLNKGTEMGLTVQKQTKEVA